MSKLAKMIRFEGVPIAQIGDYLDGLGFQERLKETRSLGLSDMKSLWELAEGAPVTLDAIVPMDRDVLVPVRHYGKNSLPLFNLFEKRFCRSPQEGILWGYNEGATRPLVGPGYFVCRETPHSSKGSVVVDYYSVPDQKPATWPEIKRNDSGITALVFGFMHDYLRRVSSSVTIGRAYKHHLETGNYFVLCRE